MMHTFSDIPLRNQCLIGVLEWVIENYEVIGEEEQKALKDELEGLTDAELIEKATLIEGYIRTSIPAIESLGRQIKVLEHREHEEKERSMMMDPSFHF